MKKLFLISSYCNTQQKIEVLIKNLKTIKSLGCDTLLLSPIYLPTEVINNTDFYFQTKENPVTPVTEKCYIHWTIVRIGDKEYKLERFFPDYGWADLYQRKKLSQIGLTFDYDIYYHVIYDTKFTDELIQEIKEGKKNQYYSNVSINGDINEFSLHFLPLNKTLLWTLSDFLDKEKYVNSHDLTHDFLKKWSDRLLISKSDYVVEEEINYYSDINFFSHSLSDDYDLYLEKSETNELKNKFVFYNVKKNITFIINSEMRFEITDDTVIETDLYVKDIDKIEIQTEDSIIDYTNFYNELERCLVVKL